eukprot:scaffold123970_cov30-Tisochrysis_lutea.AAC.1
MASQTQGSPQQATAAAWRGKSRPRGGRRHNPFSPDVRHLGERGGGVWPDSSDEQRKVEESLEREFLLQTMRGNPSISDSISLSSRDQTEEWPVDSVSA